MADGIKRVLFATRMMSDAAATALALRQHDLDSMARKDSNGGLVDGGRDHRRDTAP